MTTVSTDGLASLRNVSKRYVQRRAFSGTKFVVDALREINLTIRRDSTVALVGESGAGKSTLARCLALVEKPSEGELWFDGINLLTLNRRQLFPLRRQIQLIFQDPASALNPGMTAAEIVEEPLVIQRSGAKHERRRRALELLDQVGLPAASAKKRPLDFSGGQRQRLVLARALALRPRLLILDEALSNLDLATRDSMLLLLGVLQAELALSYVHILHDLRLAYEVSGEAAVLYQGRIVEHATTERLFAHPGHPYTQSLLHALHPFEATHHRSAVGTLS